MSVYKYSALLMRGEECFEEGAVIASDELDAKEKLRHLHYKDVHLKKLKGFDAFMRKFQADVR